MALVPCVARAEPDAFGLGSGRDGPLSVTAADTVVNAYTSLTAPRLAGDAALPVVGTAGFAAGDLVMVLQTTGLVPPPASGLAGPFDLSVDPVGRWELARLSAVSADTLSLAAPLVHGYAASVTQVLRVPEYTTVSVAAAASIVPSPWDGAKGGVVAFLATGTVTNAGAIRASGAGFRGGLFVNQATSGYGCADLDQAENAGGAQKGEGVASTRYGPSETGMGNVANGAGGGMCHNGGGGGGGHGGRGGPGGRTWLGDGSRDAGGLGGAVVTYSLFDHLTFGGGGGAGQGNDDAGTSGGNGGGAIFIRAQAFTGNGSISANGENAANTGNPDGGNTNDGAGGGGAGGSIYLRLAGPLVCGGLTASGGGGGSIQTAYHGPGGGGAGGRILVQAASLTCTPAVLSGIGGTQSAMLAEGGLPYGAGPTSATDPSAVGSLTTPAGALRVPQVPALTTPANGAHLALVRPPIAGTADANATVILYLDGFELTRLATGAGSFSFTPTSDLTEGTHQLQAATEILSLRSAKSPLRSFVVDTVPPAAPVILLPVAGSLLATATPTVSGTAEPGVNVAVRVDSLLVGTVLAEATGAWTYTLTGAQALTDGAHSAVAAALDAAGNASPSSPTVAFSTDATAPQTTVDTGPPPLTPITSATLTFSSNEAGTFECSLDGSGFTLCTSPVSLSGLVDGNYAFRVRAVDIAGNRDATPAQRNWTVDTLPPAAPVLLSPPFGAVVGPRPNVSGTTEPLATIEVVLDGVVAGTVTANSAGAWTFPSPTLVAGSHTVAARATDGAGNQGPLSPTRTFSVDDVPPETTLASGPQNPSNTRVAQFLFSSNEPGSSFECALDAGGFAACLSPRTYTGLSDGDHLFQVRAVDAAGNADPSPAAFNWTLDATPPDAPVIVTPASGASISTAAVAIVGSAEAASTVEVFVDTVRVGTTSADAFGGWRFTPSSTLSEGAHTVSARAIDSLANSGARGAEQSFTVDLTAPETSITSAPGAISNSATATFVYASNESGATFECELDDGAFVACLTTFSGLREGAHRLRVRAKDAAGNVDASPAQHAWTVDTLAPAPPEVLAPATSEELATNRPTVRGTAEARAAVEVFLDEGLVGTVTADDDGAWSYTLTADQALLPGAHVAGARAMDAAGNASTVSTRGFLLPDQTVRQTGCGCGSSGGSPLVFGSLGLLLVLSRRRRSARA